MVEKFSAQLVCCKCSAHEDIASRYCIDLDHAVHEHLHRMCGYCGYVWLEQCADANVVNAGTGNYTIGPNGVTPPEPRLQPTPVIKTPDAEQKQPAPTPKQPDLGSYESFMRGLQEDGD